MGNQNYRNERRRYKRVAIPVEDGIVGFISSPRLIADESIAVKIIDLSAGGLHFFLHRSSFKQISIGDNLTLKEIKGTKNLDFISNIELEVKWIADHQALKHVGLGCEFLHITEEIRQQIDQFVDTMRLLEVKN
ncbi:MAG: PilZ domain-containing protein [Desulfobacterales bacterium]|jgi:c-di-GMP-binding flagellar brake protein YcgR